MKKDYLRPEAEIIDIVTGNLIAASATEGEDNLPLDAGNHRGDWGNIWGEEELSLTR